jgi:hypothetical protein
VPRHQSVHLGVVLALGVVSCLTAVGLEDLRSSASDARSTATLAIRGATLHHGLAPRLKTGDSGRLSASLIDQAPALTAPSLHPSSAVEAVPRARLRFFSYAPASSRPPP